MIKLQNHDKKSNQLKKNQKNRKNQENQENYSIFT